MTEVKITENCSYFSGDNLTAYQKHKFFLLASWPKQYNFQYILQHSVVGERLMLYLPPLQNNGETTLKCSSFGVPALCSSAQTEREGRAGLGQKLAHGQRTQMLPERKLTLHRTGVCRFRHPRAEAIGRALTHN